ncbi:S8 family peptidase [Marinobacter salarius]|uniref:S8 family peptidase n=3 Tax=Marinobacter TaxID=2742 RepID=UPI00300A0B7C
MPSIKDGRQHIFLGSTGKPEKYTYPRKVVTAKNVPQQNRKEQAASLSSQLNRVKDSKPAIEREAEQYELESSIGLQVTFDSFPGVELAFESLADSRQKLELLNVRYHDDKVTVSVFVPIDKIGFFEKKIKDYLEERKDRKGGPRDNRTLIDAIESIRESAFNELWNDDDSVLPTDGQQEIWWEIWLPVLDDRMAVVHDFRKVAFSIGIEVSESTLEFPERTVLLVYCTRSKLSQSSLLMSKISEIRRAKETAEFFDAMGKEEQAEWVTELLERTKFTNNGNSPFICVLDSGINSGHPLISPVLDSNDRHVIDPSWIINDEDGHGTGMGGLSVWGDLTTALESTAELEVNWRLEGVKLIRSPGDNQGRHHGAITAEGVSLPEIQAFDRNRIYTMALSATDSRDRGRPSAWSSTIDSLCSDYLGENRFPRLMLVCAGNTGDDLTELMDYPSHNELQDIHDPGQAWNAITVGGYTRKVVIDDPGADHYKPVAPNGGLSPYSTTSLTWENSMPIKPEVVFEAGNVGKDKYSCAGLNSLKLLTTHHDISERHFSTFEATSAATALAANFSARILHEYPNLWPETVRALMIHSAEWTDAMKEQFTDPRKTDKHNAKRLARCVGFGAPSVNRALSSLKNSVVMVVEDHIQPFEKKKGKSPSTKDMHLHELPWPKDLLTSLGDTEIKMTVTLSYFVEPNPSSRNVSSKYRYPSHQLRFDVKRPTESTDAFKARMSRAAQSAEQGNTTVGNGDPNWLLGEFRHRGSIHKDVWRGSAVELSERGVVAVYPAMGWWRTRTKLESFNKTARYALIISVEAPEVDTDIYNEIQTIIDSTVETEVRIHN